MRRAWQSTVLGITVDLSALPYLLCLLPGPTPSGRPQSVGPDRIGRNRAMSKGPVYPRSEKGVRVGLRSHLGQAFRSGTGSLSRPVIMYLGRPRRMLSLRRLLGRVLQESGSIEDPGFMNPTPTIS